jgi:hypothetical protein
LLGVVKGDVQCGCGVTANCSAAVALASLQRLRIAPLRAISQGLYREEIEAFERVKSSWLTGGADELWAATDSIAERLREPAHRSGKSAT